MKNKKIIVLCGVILAAVSALAAALIVFNNKPIAKSEATKSSSEKSSDIQIEFDSTDVSESGAYNNGNDNLSFIEPDETEADKLLNDNDKLKENSKSESSKASSADRKTESAGVQSLQERDALTAERKYGIRTSTDFLYPECRTITKTAVIVSAPAVFPWNRRDFY